MLNRDHESNPAFKNGLPDHFIPLLPGDTKPDIPEMARRLDPAVFQEFEAWQNAGQCVKVDPDQFFVGKGNTPREAKAMCFKCEVGLDCAHFALVHHERSGVWGSLTVRPLGTLRKMLGMPEPPKEFED